MCKKKEYRIAETSIHQNNILEFSTFYQITHSTLLNLLKVNCHLERVDLFQSFLWPSLQGLFL